MTPDQLRLLAELEEWRLFALVDVPKWAIENLRFSRRGSTPKHPKWRSCGLAFRTYSWGIAITAEGDYLGERKVSAPEHVVTLTWQQISKWVESIPDELRAQARRERFDGGREAQKAIVDQLLDRTPTEPEELTLF